MKVALLFSGQIREIPIELFRKSLSNLTKELDYEIYIFTWREVGKSLNHSKLIPENKCNNSSEEILKNFFDGFNVKDIKIESNEDFQKQLDSKYLNIINSKEFHYGTVNSIAQIYAISKCFELIKNKLINYDLVFKCRFDSLFIHPLKLYNLKKIKNSGQVFSINFGRAYYPNRIYDIFFGGSTTSMFFLNDIWRKIPSLIEDQFSNGLDKRDACRIFYLAAKKNYIKVGSLQSRICDVFRNKKNNYYEKYILKMHFLSLKNISNLNYFYYFLNWSKYRNFKNFIILFYLFKTFLLIPFSYVKGFKYKFFGFKI